MKKILSIIMVLTTILLAIVACGRVTESNDELKEYDVEEFGKLLQDTNRLFAKESEGMTEDELSGEERRDLYEKCAQEIGLPLNTKVILHGEKASGTIGFTLFSPDRKYHVPCIFGDTKKNQSLLIKDGENVTVTGAIINEVSNRGYLADIAIISPENIEATFESNISETLANLDDDIKIVQGEVAGVLSLEHFELKMEAAVTTNYVHNDNYDNTVVQLKDEGESIYFICDSSISGNLEIGDKVAVQGFVRSLMDTKRSDGTTWVMWGLINGVRDLYLFD